MQKAYSRIKWENEPSQETPLNDANLNRMDAAIDEVDNRIINLDITKANKTEISELFNNISFDESTGVLTFTRKNGSTIRIDTKLEKLAVNFSYDAGNERLVITLDDGSVQYVDMKALITQYEFTESDTIILSVDSSGKVKATIKKGSITGDMLEPNYLANVTVQAESAAASAASASASAESAKNDADRAEDAASRAESIVGFTIDTELDAESTNPIANKAVAEEFGKYLPKSGGYITGAEVGIGSANSESGYTFGLKNAKRFITEQVLPDGTYRIRDTNNAKNIITSTADGTNTFNGTASGNLPLTGGNVDWLYVKGTQSVPMRVYNQNGLGVTIQFVGLNNEVYGRIGFDGYTPVIYDKDNLKNTILHTGNKPTGSYTGNGSATARNISTGGIGDVCVIYTLNYNSVCIVTKYGFFGHIGGSLKGGSTVTMSNGTITIASSENLVNANGVTYYYKVL